MENILIHVVSGTALFSVGYIIGRKVELNSARNMLMRADTTVIMLNAIGIANAVLGTPTKKKTSAKKTKKNKKKAK